MKLFFGEFNLISGYGLLTSGGQQWARNRRLLTPAFHFDVLKPYVNIYTEGADKLIVRYLKAQFSVEDISMY